MLLETTAFGLPNGSLGSPFTCDRRIEQSYPSIYPPVAFHSLTTTIPSLDVAYIGPKHAGWPSNPHSTSVDYPEPRLFAHL